ncbi:MAG TPA: hypothetical protein VGL64_16245 [Amycolatopsis sp.]|jgi:hypothetical protein
MPKRPIRPRRRDRRSCLVGGQAGNVAIGSAGSHPPRQPTGPTHPGGTYRSNLFRWRPDPPAQDED